MTAPEAPEQLPLFPLSSVLVPHGRLPLQIFEQRYLDLVRECLKSATVFGVVWIRRGQEVAQAGAAKPELGDYGTSARIVDWDQLPNGLLGITIEGAQRFDLHNVTRRTSGLWVGEVSWRPVLPSVPTDESWQPLVAVLRSLVQHRYVQRMQLQFDETDAWQVAWTLLQLLPLESAVKYELLGLDDINELRVELECRLSDVSGVSSSEQTQREH